MRRLCAWMLAVSLLGSIQGCQSCMHGRCDCLDFHGQPLDLGTGHGPAVTPVSAPAAPVQEAPKTMPIIKVETST